MYSQRETITICMAITRHLVLRVDLYGIHVGQVCVETEAASTRFFLMTKLLFGSWHLLSSNILFRRMVTIPITTLKATTISKSSHHVMALLTFYRRSIDLLR